jgi:outer membrane protein OmpA-like peptidoglycan-associated protein
MLRLRTSSLLVLLACAGACAPVRQRGALSPINARVTNEVIAEDTQTLESWGRRVSTLQQPDGAPGSGPRAYVIARAAAWLAYAREAYAWDPRDGAADIALGETRRLVVALEGDTLPDVSVTPALTDARARPDLWAVLEQARGGVARERAPAAVADAEVALVRASRLVSGVPMGEMPSHPMTELERACEIQAQVAIAERLLDGFRTGPVALPAPVVVVALQGAPTAAPMPVRVAAPAPPKPVRRGVERVVHFAVNSSALALQSRVTLGEVISMLRSHPKANLVIRGFTDPRGDEGLNRDLAARRAEAVRRYLDAATLDLGRVTMEGIGTDSAAVGHATVDMFAHDRRVTLSFTGPDGAALTVAGLEALDVDHERDLQVERGARGPRTPRAGRSRGTSPSRPR